jgi:hypothetical protein
MGIIEKWQLLKTLPVLKRELVFTDFSQEHSLAHIKVFMKWKNKKRSHFSPTMQS